MRKRVFGSIILTALITLGLTAVLLLAAVYSGLSSDMQQRLAQEWETIAAQTQQQPDTEQVIEQIGRTYVDRITLIAQDGSVLYDNRSDEQLEDHSSRPEVAQALAGGVGTSSRFSKTLDQRTYYYARQLTDGVVLRLSATADSAFASLYAVSPWVVLVLMLTLLVAAVLASWLTRAFLEPIASLDLHDPLKNEAYDELSPLLHRMDKQNRRIEAQMHELGRRQDEFDEITAHMDEGLVLISAAGEVLFLNQAAKTLFGIDQTGGNYLTLCRDAAFIRVVEEALDGESARGMLERKGRIYALTASSAEGAGRGHAAALFLMDVTERERAEQQRREFTANVSHELKTPLTSIMGYAEIVENGVAKPADVPRFAGKIRSEARRLLALIEDIIRLSQLDEGGAELPFEPVELASLCETVRSRLQQKAEKLQIDVRTEGGPAEVRAERRTLEQMVFNLCDNAITYNRPGGSVCMRVGVQDGAPFVAVADTGIGIAPADQPRVFERFYRVDKSHSRQSGGTGLGLSIVKHGAALHGASIEMESELGRGTTITLRFPAPHEQQNP